MHAAALGLGFQPVYFPYVHESSIFASLFSGRKSLSDWISLMPFNASPATDDSPFFYNDERGPPSALSSLFYGVLFLTSLFLFVAWLSLEHSLKYCEKFGSTEIATRKLGPSSILLYFLLLGVAFMLVEVALVQKFILFLGQPTLAFTVVLVSLLVGSGTGSFLSDRFETESVVRRLASVLFFVGVLLAIFAVSLPFVFEKFLGQNIIARTLISVCMLYPLGFSMGIPFPTGLKISKQTFKRDVGWMWGMNGMASVLGSVLAVIVAVSSGFTLALVLGAGSYLLAGFVLTRPQRLFKGKKF